MTRGDQIELPDGRRLDVWAAEEPADGLPLVFHHGTPSSRLPYGGMLRAAERHRLRLVTTSRPGYGDSTRKAGRSVADVAADTAAVLDRLGADRCVTAGWSGGGPHALACGAGLPDRVAAVLVIAGVAPHNASGLDWLAGMGEENITELGLAEQGEAALRPYLDRQAEQLGGADLAQVIAELDTVLPGVDRAVLTDEFGAHLVDSLHEAVRTGVDGWLDDDLAFVRPWGFELTEIDRPTFLWQGSEDKMVPFPHGEWLAARIPGVGAHLEQGEGHLSVGVGGLDRMFAELAAAAR